jgi:hypothetical protein
MRTQPRPRPLAALPLIAAALLTLGLLCAAPGRAAADTLWPRLDTPADTPADATRDAAVVIGIEDYVFIPDIPGALQNAQDWWQYLQGRGVALQHVALLRNADATVESITDAITQAKAQVQPGGTLWVVFIGHGVPAPDGSDGLLVGADAQQTARSVQARGISRQALTDLASGDGYDTVMVLDACFSGQDRLGASLVPGLQPMVLVQAPAPKPRALVLSAAGGDEFAGALPLAQRPAFSYLLLGALRGWGDADADGEVSPSEAINYTRSTLQVLLRDRRQTPALSGAISAPALARGAREPGPNIPALVLALYPAPVITPVLTPLQPDPRAGGEVTGGIPSPDYVRGTNWARLFIGGGFAQDVSYINGTASDSISTTGFKRTKSTTGSTSSYVSTPDKYSFKLTEQVTSPSLIGALDMAWARNGFGLVLSGELGWTQPKATGLITADAFSITADEEDKTDFTEGVKVSLAHMFWLDMSAEGQYRVVFGNQVGLYVQAGAGLRVTWLQLTNMPLEQQSNIILDDDMTLTNYALMIPVRAGLDYNFADDYALNLRYSLLVLSPSLIHTVQLGVGLPL